MRIGWNLPLERLSATSLGLAITCPEQFRVKYLAERKPEETMFSSRFIGIVDHETMSRLLTRKMRGVTVDEEMVASVHNEVWNETIEINGEPQWGEDDPIKMIDRSIRMSKMYVREALPKITPVGVEERFEFTIPGLPAKVVGYIDCLERHQIKERKTTAVKTTKPKSKWRFQAIIYQFAVGLPVEWDVITRQATPQLYTAREHADLRMEMTDPSVARQLIIDGATRINDLYAKYGAENHWPMEGLFASDWFCDYCPIGPKYERSCPAWGQTPKAFS